jgi:MFS family permease
MVVNAETDKQWTPGTGALTLLCVGHGVTHFVFAATIMLLPYIRQDGGLSYTEAASLGTIYYIAAFIANFFSGYWVDAAGKRVMVQLAAVLMSGGGVIAAGLAGYVLDGFSLFIVLAIGWAFSGMGNQAWHPAAFSYLAKYYDDRRSFVFSIHVVAANVGDAVFPLIAGFLLGHVFVTAAGQALWQPVAIFGGIPCLVVAVVLVVYLMPRDREIIGGPPKSMSAKSYFEGYGALLKNKNAMLLALVAGLRNASQTALLYFLPLYMVDVIQTGPVLVGIALTLLQVGGIIGAPIAGYAADRTGARPVVFACLTLTTIILVVALFVKQPTHFVVVIAFMGFALYAVRPVVQSWMMDLVPEDFRGSATSVMFGVQSAMNVVFLSVAGPIADAYSLVTVFYIIAGVILVANILTFALPKETGRKQVSA